MQALSQAPGGSASFPAQLAVDTTVTPNSLYTYYDGAFSYATLTVQTKLPQSAMSCMQPPGAGTSSTGGAAAGGGAQASSGGAQASSGGSSGGATSSIGLSSTGFGGSSSTQPMLVVLLLSGLLAIVTATRSM